MTKWTRELDLELKDLVEQNGFTKGAKLFVEAHPEATFTAAKNRYYKYLDTTPTREVNYKTEEPPREVSEIRPPKEEVETFHTSDTTGGASCCADSYHDFEASVDELSVRKEEPSKLGKYQRYDRLKKPNIFVRFFRRLFK